MIYLLDLVSLPENAPCSHVRFQELETLRNPSLIRQKRGAEALLWHAFAHAFPGEKYPFDYPRTAAGKPYFPKYPDFHFSLSHARGYVLCAAYCKPCGADLEAVGRVGEAVCTRFFHPIECAFLSRCTPQQRHAAAAQIWCLREAYGKALGIGLSGVGTDFWALPNGENNAAGWNLRAYLPIQGFAAAVCVQDTQMDLQILTVHL